MDIFDRSYIEGLFRRWTGGTLPVTSGCAAVLYLVLAYAAQARCASSTDLHRSQAFFNHGRHIALAELTNEPKRETTQAFLLISLYMLGCSRRNGAHLNLGIAIGAARSLGYHQSASKADNDGDEQMKCVFACLRLTHIGSLLIISQSRRIWRTLCYHDLFFCAMMGRTPSTTASESTDLDGPRPDSNHPDFCQQLGLLESARAFSIMKRTVIEIYSKQSVPLGLLQYIFRELQEMSSNIPVEMRALVFQRTSDRLCPYHQQNVLRNVNVTCNYSFSMMLLTRPFLIASLRGKYSKRPTGDGTESQADFEDSQTYRDIVQGALSCIEAAIKTIHLLHELLVAGMLFNNMPLVV